MGIDDVAAGLASGSVAVCHRPIFIIGSPRSGTTALGHALNRHPELWASKECYALHALYGGGQADRVWKQHWERKTPSWLRAQEVDRAEFLGFLGLGVNALYSSRSEGRRWVDPTPLNTLMVNDLSAMVPGAYFIHIVRDGRNVVRSMRRFRQTVEELRGPIPSDEMSAWTRDFREACATWVNHVETALRFEQAHPQRCVTVRNEDLAAEPYAGFGRIHRFLGVAADDGPAEFFDTTRINSSFRRGFQPSSEPDWGDWDPDRRREFTEIAGATLVRAGCASGSELEMWADSGAATRASGIGGD